jgi:hypothetical protein
MLCSLCSLEEVYTASSSSGSTKSGEAANPEIFTRQAATSSLRGIARVSAASATKIMKGDNLRECERPVSPQEWAAPSAYLKQTTAQLLSMQRLRRQPSVQRFQAAAEKVNLSFNAYVIRCLESRLREADAQDELRKVAILT